MSNGIYAIVVDDDYDTREVIESIFPLGRIQRCESFASRREFSQQYLVSSRNGQSTEYLPAILFVDIRMESPDAGLRLLEEIKEDSRLRNVPVVMISSSDEEANIYDAYKLGASMYLVKDDSPVEFREAIRKLGELVDAAVKVPADILDYLEGELGRTNV